MALTDEQLAEIRRLLDTGMDPDAIAHSLARMSDLDLIATEEIRTAARALADEPKT
ncbi:hypothetical protein AB0N05_37590 [Nocardia sp. NPDC051030]|uniref:hypothetical protein n=1 Tax=Nocardia sp. NPDC051030 TaxID=3155162 RepID=UPI003439244E